MDSEGRTRIALAGLVVVTLLSFGQVVEGGDFFGPALLGAGAAAALTAGARRIGLGAATAAALSAAGLVAYLCIVFRPGATWWGLPTPGAVEGLVRSVRTAAEASRVDFAPVPARAGYIVLIVAALWLLTTFAEIAIFRWRRPLAASLPAVALFAIAVAVGTDDGGGPLVALFLAALVTLWAVESSHRLRSWGSWVSAWADRGPEPGSVAAATARRMGSGCVAAALLAPLFMPALGDGLVAWRSSTGSGDGRAALDPLVSLLPRLIERSDRERFTVTTQSPTYYRVFALTRFDGEEWLPPPRPNGVMPQETLSPEAGPWIPGRSVTDFRLSGLSGDRLPVPANPVRVRFESLPGLADDVRFNLDTGEVRLVEGIPGAVEYSVEAIETDPTFEELERSDVGADPGGAYTGIPELSPEVRRLALRWTAGHDSPFAKLVALQDRFRNDFTYSLDVSPRASEDYLTEFLTRTRTGYCQQFATAFTLLARTLGYPSRVVAGYLPGFADVNIRNRYVVTDNEAHAWPEVLFDDFGWIRFEPTPRSDIAISTPSYTAPTPGGGGGGGGGGAGRGDGPGLGSFFEAESERIRAGRALIPEPPVSPTAASGRDPEWRGAFARLARSLAFLALAWLVAVPVAKAALLARLRRTASTPADAVAAAFARLEFEAAELGSGRRPWESAAMFAARLGAAGRVAPEPAARLARLHDAALFGPRPAAGADAVAAAALARSAAAQLWKSASPSQRMRRLFSAGALARRLRAAASGRRGLPRALARPS